MGYKGIVKPEPLKGNLQCFKTCRIDDSNGFIYCIEEGVIEMAQCLRQSLQSDCHMHNKKGNMAESI